MGTSDLEALCAKKPVFISGKLKNKKGKALSPRPGKKKKEKREVALRWKEEDVGGQSFSGRGSVS